MSIDKIFYDSDSSTPPCIEVTFVEYFSFFIAIEFILTYNIDLVVS